MASLSTLLPLQGLDGEPVDTGALEGRVVLFVNVASRCGLTPQYSELVTLAQRHREAGLVVVGVPCNQFGRQEPGTAEEIQTFCATRYGVDFPLLEKQDVNGATRSPLYRWLVGGGADIAWNFEKFLVDRSGAVIARFAPTVAPLGDEITGAVAAAL